MPCKQQSDLSEESDCVLKYLLGIIRSDEKKKIECNAGSFEVLGAIGTRSFGKSCKCIHKSEPSCWKSSSGQSFDSITATNEQFNE
jgi:hypothetical protein